MDDNSYSGRIPTGLNITLVTLPEWIKGRGRSRSLGTDPNDSARPGKPLGIVDPRSPPDVSLPLPAPSMSKRNASGCRTSRKRMKSGYASLDFDAFNESRRDNKHKVEEIRVWDVTASGTNGRVSATRRNHQLIYESPPEPSREEVLVVRESIFTPTGPELSEPLPVNSVAKRRRVRIAKENDSVSFVSTLLTKLIIVAQTRMADWLTYRSTMLDEFLRIDGLGDSATTGTCVNCKTRPGEYRCRECFGSNMCCSACILSTHVQLPLHRLQVRVSESSA